MNCQKCSASMLPLFTGSYCPNDCDRPPKPRFGLPNYVTINVGGVVTEPSCLVWSIPNIGQKYAASGDTLCYDIRVDTKGGNLTENAAYRFFVDKTTCQSAWNDGIEIPIGTRFERVPSEDYKP